MKDLSRQCNILTVLIYVLLKFINSRNKKILLDHFRRKNSISVLDTFTSNNIGAISAKFEVNLNANKTLSKKNCFEFSKK